MKITISSSDGTRSATVETKHDDMTILDVQDELLFPVLVAYGFMPESVNGIFLDNDG